MKRKISYLCAIGVLVVCVIGFNGCSMENDYPEVDDLRLERQISMMNYDVSDGGIGVPQIIVRENECALYTLTLLRINSLTSQEEAMHKYDTMKSYAEQHYNYHGGAMPYTTMVEVGKHYNVITGEQSFRAENDSVTVGEYLENVSLGKLKTVNLDLGESYEHVGKVCGYDAANGMIRYEDYQGKHWTPITNVRALTFK